VLSALVAVGACGRSEGRWTAQVRGAPELTRPRVRVSRGGRDIEIAFKLVRVPGPAPHEVSHSTFVFHTTLRVSRRRRPVRVDAVLKGAYAAGAGQQFTVLVQLEDASATTLLRRSDGGPQPFCAAAAARYAGSTQWVRSDTPVDCPLTVTVVVIGESAAPDGALPGFLDLRGLTLTATPEPRHKAAARRRT
jgi:hypothetical protein